MAIRKKVVAGISTHFKNETKQAVETSDSSVTNNFEENKLFDPEDIEGGSTHTTEPLILASVLDEVDPDPESHNVSTIDPDVDPAAGYLDTGADTSLATPGMETNSLVTAADEDEDEDDEDDEGEEEDDFEEEEEDEDWDQPEAAPAEEEVDADFDEDILGDEPIADETEDEEVDIPAGDADGVQDLVDVDEMPDDQVNGMVFASIGSKLMVIKSNRIIATMTKAAAEEVNASDMYLTDQFQDATADEVRRQGLRAGLKNMGFVMAKVNVGKSETINRRVESKVKVLTAAVRRTHGQKDKVLAQCMAIASVGINRRFFKKTENVLAQSLIENLQNAGVRNAARVVNASFAQYGVDYAKSIITLANTLVDMPEPTRNQFAEALDLVDDSGEFIEESTAIDEDMIEDGAGADFVDAEFDEFAAEDLEDVPATVTAALSFGGRPSKAALLTRTRGVSLSASAILDGDAPLTFQN